MDNLAFFKIFKFFDIIETKSFSKIRRFIWFLSQSSRISKSSNSAQQNWLHQTPNFWSHFFSTADIHFTPLFSVIKLINWWTYSLSPLSVPYKFVCWKRKKKMFENFELNFRSNQLNLASIFLFSADLGKNLTHQIHRLT